MFVVEDPLAIKKILTHLERKEASYAARRLPPSRAPWAVSASGVVVNNEANTASVCCWLRLQSVDVALHEAAPDTFLLFAAMQRT